MNLPAGNAPSIQYIIPVTISSNADKNPTEIESSFIMFFSWFADQMNLRACSECIQKQNKNLLIALLLIQLAPFLVLEKRIYLKKLT